MLLRAAHLTGYIFNGEIMMISIIVPIYKVEKFINQCVDSILGQSYKDIEIILVDDGSPDNCPHICDKYAEEDSRIKVVHKKNGGLMSARQAGLRVASGEYVGFVDGDDWIESDMYESFADVIEKYHPDIVLCEFFYSFADKETPSEQKLKREFFTKQEIEQDIFPTMLFKTPYYRFGINPCCWSKVFKKELLESKLFHVTPKIKIGEDAAFTYPCILSAGSLAYIDKSLYHYRSNPDSMTNVYDESLENTIMLPYEILKAQFSASEYDFSKQLSYYLLYMINLVVRNEANPSCKKRTADKIKTLKAFTNNSDVVAAGKGVDSSLLPVHTKLVAKFLAWKNPYLLYLYSLLLRRFL